MNNEQLEAKKKEIGEKLKKFRESNEETFEEMLKNVRENHRNDTT